MPSAVTPKLLCASYQLIRRERPVLRALDEDRLRRRAPRRHRGVRQRGIFRRRCSASRAARAARSSSSSPARPLSGRNVTVAVASASPGFASSTNVVKNEPVAPSARNQLVAGAFTPADSWPALNSGVPEVHRALRHARLRRTSTIDAERPVDELRESSLASTVAARRRRERERLDDRRAAFAQERHGRDVRRRARIREQHVRLEEALRAFREEPRRAPDRPSPSRCARRSRSHPSASCARRRAAAPRST